MGAWLGNRWAGLRRYLGVRQREAAITALIAERDALKTQCVALEERLGVYDSGGFPPGHFYSPVADVSDPHVLAAVTTTRALAGAVAFDPEQILCWMRRLAVHQSLFAFPRTKEEGFRYYRENPAFGVGDASVLFAMLLEFRPKQVVEVGCGFSSCLLLDTNEQFFGGSIGLTFIDPNLERAQQRFGPRGAPGARLMPLKLQDVPLEVFDELEAGDILFLDSSHVSKAGSDVNHYMFRILPRLRPGVVIHIHDIGYPFEYAEEAVIRLQRNWSEAYLLQAFLQFNGEFEILYWVDFVNEELRDQAKELMPLSLADHGGSLWLRRVQNQEAA